MNCVNVCVRDADRAVMMREASEREKDKRPCLCAFCFSFFNISRACVAASNVLRWLCIHTDAYNCKCEQIFLRCSLRRYLKLLFKTQQHWPDKGGMDAGLCNIPHLPTIWHKQMASKQSSVLNYCSTDTCYEESHLDKVLQHLSDQKKCLDALIHWYSKTDLFTQSFHFDSLPYCFTNQEMSPWKQTHNPALVATKHNRLIWRK